MNTAKMVFEFAHTAGVDQPRPCRPCPDTVAETHPAEAAAEEAEAVEGVDRGGA